MGIIDQKTDDKIAAVSIVFAMEHEIDPKIVHDYARLLVDVDTGSMEMLALIAGVIPSNSHNDVYVAFFKACDRRLESTRDLWNRLKKNRLVR